MEGLVLSRCPICGYPVNAEYPGQTTQCAFCGTKLEATITEGVTIPTPLLVGVVCFALGIFLGPSIIASTESGSRWLEKQARERIR